MASTEGTGAIAAAWARPPYRRPRSLPLQIAKWLALVCAVLVVLWIFVILTGLTHNILGYVLERLLPLLLLAPWFFAALFVWHWAAAVLSELRAIRAALRKLHATLEQPPPPQPTANPQVTNPTLR